MNNTAQQQATAPAPEMSAIAEQITLIAAGISFAAKHVAGDDLYYARMGRLSDEVLALATDFQSYAHQEIDDYDGMVELVEQRDGELVALRLETNLLSGKAQRLADELEQATGTHDTAVAALEHCISQVRTEMESLRASLTNELKQAREKAARLHDEAESARTSNGDLTRKLHSELNAHLDTRKLLQVETRKSKDLQKALEIIYDEQDVINGVVGNETWQGLNNPKLHFYVHTFHYALRYPYDPRDIDSPRFVNNLSFHINIRTTYGVDLVARLDEWGMVQYQSLDMFKSEMPEDLYAYLVKSHHDIVALRNPHLKKFFDWAHTFSITDLKGLSAAHLKLLQEEMKVENLAQLGACFTSDLTRLKGIGEVTARKLRALAYEQGAAWMAKHGPVELDKPMTGMQEHKKLVMPHGGQQKPKIGRSKKHRKGKSR